MLQQSRGGGGRVFVLSPAPLVDVLKAVEAAVPGGSHP
jgi:hypothetical protein